MKSYLTSIAFCFLLISINNPSLAEEESKTKDESYIAKYVTSIRAKDLAPEQIRIRKVLDRFHKGIQLNFKCENLHLLEIKLKSWDLKKWKIKGFRNKGNAVFYLDDPALNGSIDKLRLNINGLITVGSAPKIKTIDLDVDITGEIVLFQGAKCNFVRFDNGAYQIRFSEGQSRMICSAIVQSGDVVLKQHYLYDANGDILLITFNGLNIANFQLKLKYFTEITDQKISLIK